MEIASELLPCVNLDGKLRMHSDYNAQVHRASRQQLNLYNFTNTIPLSISHNTWAQDALLQRPSPRQERSPHINIDTQNSNTTAVWFIN
jgi:hypothetical protein